MADHGLNSKIVVKHNMVVAERITVEPDKLGGKPCIRGLRFPVTDLLGLLAAGMTPDEIVADYPDIELEDIPAALNYAASLIGKPTLAAE